MSTHPAFDPKDRNAWNDWIRALKVGDEVLTRSGGHPVIAKVTKATAYLIDFDCGMPIKFRKGQMVGYIRDVKPVGPDTRKMISAFERGVERERMNNEIRHLATKLSRIKAEKLLRYAREL